MSDLFQDGVATDETGRGRKGHMTFFEHLAELRRRLIFCAIAIAIGMLVAFIFYGPIVHVLQEPYCRAAAHAPKGQLISGRGKCQLYATGPLDGFSFRIKISVWGGVLLALPVILYQLWRFITPGLTKKERKYAVPFLGASLVLFTTGSVIAYFFFERALTFLQRIGGPSITPIYQPNSYVGLMMTMMFLFGLSFEFPVVLVALELVGVVTPKKLLQVWRYSCFGIIAVAALFTPSGDPVTMAAMAIPLTCFYFIAIGIGKLFGK